MMRFLIVKTSSLGDIIHTFPVVAYLKKKFPQSDIDWIVERPFAELVQAHPLVNTVHCIDTKKWRQQIFNTETFKGFSAFYQELKKLPYDVLFDFQGNTKSAVPTFLARSKVKVGFGRTSFSEVPNMLVTHRRFTPPLNVNVRDENIFLAQQYFKDTTPFVDEGVQLIITDQQRKDIEDLLAHPNLQKGKKILVCPGSNWKNKQLTLETLKKFLKMISDNAPSAFLFIWGSAEEKLVAEGLQASLPDNSVVVDRMPLSKLQNLMGKVDLVISMDSLPLHLAGTTSTPTFSVFGASSANKYRPKGKQHISLQGPCPYGRTFERRCPVLRTCPTGACIRELSAETLFFHYSADLL